MIKLGVETNGGSKKWERRNEKNEQKYQIRSAGRVNLILFADKVKGGTDSL